MNFDAERIDACLDAGANRFSLVFSRLTAKSARKWPAPRMANRHCVYGKPGQTRPCSGGLYLLFGLPGQDAQTWGEDLTIPAISVSTASISMHSMSCPTHAGQSRGKWAYYRALSGRTSHLYLQGCDFMDEAGWRCISNATGAVPHANAISITC